MIDWAKESVARRLHRRAIPANRQAARGIAVFSQLDGARTLLDLGGGAGILALGFLEIYPKLRVTLVDLAASADLARKRFRRSGMLHRVEVKAADFFSGDLGSGYDACLISRVVRFFGAATNLRLLAKAFHALAAGGRLILHDEFTWRDSLRHDGFNAWPLLDVQSWLKQVGFIQIQEVIPLQLILARKPLKEEKR